MTFHQDALARFRALGNMRWMPTRSKRWGGRPTSRVRATGRSPFLEASNCTARRTAWGISAALINLARWRANRATTGKRPPGTPRASPCSGSRAKNLASRRVERRGELAALAGQAERGARLLGAAEALREAMGMPPPRHHARHDQAVAGSCRARRRHVSRSAGGPVGRCRCRGWDTHGASFGEDIVEKLPRLCQGDRQGRLRAGHRPQAARPARRHAGRLGRRVRAHADERGAQRLDCSWAAITIRGRSRCGSPAAA